MTGRHEFRNGVTHTILERERLSLEAVTIAQVLQQHGYATGIFGKWHLGDEPAYRPDKRGFEETFIHGGGGIGQTYPGSCGDAPNNTYFSPTILHNGRFKKTNGYCTDVFFGQAKKWIDSVRHKRPFFAYISLNAPHGPLLARFEDEQRYAGKVPGNVAKFFGMISNIDENIGRLLDDLKKWDIERDTLVVFMNDNGGTHGVKIFNANMRGGKNTPWLGGTRAASFWRWPGTLTPGDIHQLAAHIDFVPTILELADIDVSAKLSKQLEGHSLAPLLKDRHSQLPDRVLVTHLGRWKRGEATKAKYAGCSVRSERWHLVSTGNSEGKDWKLFDVKSDPQESTNLVAKYPEVVRQLDSAYDGWWSSIQSHLVNENAVGPRANPFKEMYWEQFKDRY